MSAFLQFAVPFVTALLVLGIFHLVAYLHLQLTDSDLTPGSKPGAGSGSRPGANDHERGQVSRP